MTNIDKLAEIFPQCITEAEDDDGNLIRTIDFELLRQILSDDLIDGREAYVFDFVGKKRATLEAYKPIRKTLRPIVDRSRDFDTTKNIYIEGDNLDALKILQESYLHKVKLIYIDPPYNTGGDFIYRNDFTRDVDGNRILNRENRGRFHSDWCAMIYSRLLLAKHFLSDDGAIFISIDDHEQANLKKICDEVFGEKNFVANIVWKRKPYGNNMGFIPPVHDFILVYCKDSTQLKPFALPQSKEYLKDKYSNPDNDPRGDWATMSLTASHKGPHFAITNPNTGEKFFPPRGRYWVFNEAEVLRRIADGRIIFGKSGTTSPVQKVFAAERSLTTKPNTWFDKQGYNGDGTNELLEIFEQKIFISPKPTSLIEYILKFATDRDSIVMDFFGGSSTTAHAVMKLNAQDGGNRQFIMIQLPESTPENSEARRAGYQTICDIGEERIRRAGDKLKIDNPELDTGFRVFKVDGANFIDMPDEWTQEILPDFVENIKPDRNALDLLFGELIETGATIDDTLTIETLDGHDVLNYGGKILACFEKNLPEKFFHKLAKRKPDKILFRDALFASSAVKINALEYFRYVAPDTIVKVL